MKRNLVSPFLPKDATSTDRSIQGDVICTCVRFTCNRPNPSRAEPHAVAPGRHLAAHFLEHLPRHGIDVQASTNDGIHHTLTVSVPDEGPYKIKLGYDWLDDGWWMITYDKQHPPTLQRTGRSFAFDRTRQSKATRALTLAIAECLQGFPNVTEQRWYATYQPRATAAYTAYPQLDASSESDQET